MIANNNLKYIHDVTMLRVIKQYLSPRSPQIRKAYVRTHQNNCDLLLFKRQTRFRRRNFNRKSSFSVNTEHQEFF